MRFSKSLKELNATSEGKDSPASAAAMLKSFSRVTLLQGPISLTQLARMTERARDFGDYRCLDIGYNR